jgi:hypothetical protein
MMNLLQMTFSLMLPEWVVILLSITVVGIYALLMLHKIEGMSSEPPKIDDEKKQNVSSNTPNNVSN